MIVRRSAEVAGDEAGDAAKSRKSGCLEDHDHPKSPPSCKQAFDSLDVKKAGVGDVDDDDEDEEQQQEEGDNDVFLLEDDAAENIDEIEDDRRAEDAIGRRISQVLNCDSEVSTDANAYCYYVYINYTTLFKIEFIT